MPDRFCAAVPLNLCTVGNIDSFSQAAVFRPSKDEIVTLIKIKKNHKIPIPINAFLTKHTYYVYFKDNSQSKFLAKKFM
jgi:hypothetical protein